MEGGGGGGGGGGRVGMGVVWLSVGGVGLGGWLVGVGEVGWVACGWVWEGFGRMVCVWVVYGLPVLPAWGVLGVWWIDVHGGCASPPIQACHSQLPSPPADGPGGKGRRGVLRSIRGSNCPAPPPVKSMASMTSMQV